MNAKFGEHVVAHEIARERIRGKAHEPTWNGLVPPIGHHPQRVGRAWKESEDRYDGGLARRHHGSGDAIQGWPRAIEHGDAVGESWRGI